MRLHVKGPCGPLKPRRLRARLPALSSVKLVNYDEDKWTAARAKTMEQIKDVLQESR